MSGGIITRKQILRRIADDNLITNIPPKKPNAISSGDTICGYDITLDMDFLSISVSGTTMAPKRTGESAFGSMRRPTPFSVGPGNILTAQSVEEFTMPLDLIAVAQQRSAYNNFGIVVNMPPLLPGYKGKARFAITNFSRNGVLIYPGEGLCTLMFHTVALEDGEVGEAYTGKYNGLDTITVLPPVGA